MRRHSLTFTVGFATYDDFSGAYFTLQSLRLYFPGMIDELVIVDNNPNGPDGAALKNLAANAKAKYVPLENPVGTSPARNKLFEVASGDVVLCLDCHVLLLPGALEALRSYYQREPDSQDLVQGPLVYDDLTGLSTHFRDQWRAEMWGVWARDARADNPQNPPFEIPASGLGLFACRRDAWLGFHPHARHFGGEEFYIHEKFRKAGRKCLCLPALRWVHRFYRRSVPYKVTQWHKVRNYILELQELGEPLDRLYRHFVLQEAEPNEDGSPGQAALTRMPQDVWDALVKDPVNTLPEMLTGAQQSGCGGCGSGKSQVASAEEWFAHQHQTHPDLRVHLPRLRELAQQSEVVAEMGNSRGGSTAALLAAQPKRLYSVDINPPSWQTLAERIKGQTELVILRGDSRALDLPEDVDLLFIDTVHRADYLYPELERHAPRVRKWIVLHDTEIFGEHGEQRVGDNGPVPGLLPALRRFLREHPEWTVVHHTREQYGLTTLSRRPEDKNPLPSTARQIFNFAKAVTQHIAAGRPIVSPEVLERRLDICALCEHRVENRCGICGCYLIDSPTGAGGKAEWADQACPLGKWLDVSVEGE